MERIEGLTTLARTVDEAYLTHYAFHSGPKLKEEHDRVHGLLRLAPGESPGTLDEPTRAAVFGLMATWGPKPPAEVS